MEQVHKLSCVLLYRQALLKMYIAQRLDLDQTVGKLAAMLLVRCSYRLLTSIHGTHSKTKTQTHPGMSRHTAFCTWPLLL